MLLECLLATTGSVSELVEQDHDAIVVIDELRRDHIADGNS